MKFKDYLQQLQRQNIIRKVKKRKAKGGEKTILNKHKLENNKNDNEICPLIERQTFISSFFLLYTNEQIR